MAVARGPQDGAVVGSAPFLLRLIGLYGDTHKHTKVCTQSFAEGGKAPRRHSY